MDVWLSTLDPEFIKRVLHDGNVYHEREVKTIAEADGIMFLCPKCYVKNSGPVGTHSVICWFVGKVPDDAVPGPGRWTPEGAGIHDLSFVPGNPPRAKSVALTGGCAWHGFIQNGMCTDA